MFKKENEQYNFPKNNIIIDNKKYIYKAKHSNEDYSYWYPRSQCEKII